jgi:hypothetical protein
MMAKHLEDLMAAATYRRFSSERNLDQWLTEQGVTDPTTRIGVKHYFESVGKFIPSRGEQISAVGELRTDEVLTLGSLATDLPRHRYTPVSPPPTYRPGMTAAERLLARLGVTAPVTLKELEKRMTEAGLDAEPRIMVKTEAALKNLLRG